MEYYNDTRIATLCDRAKRDMAKVAHHGQVNAPMFRKIILSHDPLVEAFSRLPTEDGRVPDAPKELDPDDAIDALSGLVPHAAAAAAGRRDSGASASAATGAAGAADGADATKTKTGGLAYGQINMLHPRFEGDKFKVEDPKRQMAAEETGRPNWYFSRQQVWCVLDGQPPVPIETDHY